MRPFVILRETAVPTTSLHSLSSPQHCTLFGLHKYEHMGNAKNAPPFGRRLAVFFWAAVQMVWSETKQPQQQTAIQRSRQTQLPLSLHIPGWNPMELTWAKTDQADQDPRNTLLGLEKAGNGKLLPCFYTPSSFEQDLPGWTLSCSWGFLSSIKWPHWFLTLFLEPYDDPIGSQWVPQHSLNSWAWKRHETMLLSQNSYHTHSLLNSVSSPNSFYEGWLSPLQKDKDSKESTSGFFQNLPN